VFDVEIIRLNLKKDAASISRIAPGLNWKIAARRGGRAGVRRLK
jgi:hypothetical protein